MIYLNNNTEVQEIYIPRQTVLGGGYIATTKTYEDGLMEGIERGKEIQKDQLLNLYVTENGQYEREDGWGVVTVDVPTEGGDCSGAYDKGFEDGYNQGQAECPEGGSCNLGEGEIFLTTNDVGTYEMYASDDDYDGWSKFIVTLEGGGAIKVYKASDLLDIFNNGETIDYGAYYYVGGEITEIQEVNTQYGNATYTLDNGFKIYRGKWFDGNGFSSEDQIKVGAYIVVYGIIQDYNGTLQFKAGSQVIAYQECEGGEGNCDDAYNQGYQDGYNQGQNDCPSEGGCNLEDKWVNPSMGDRDGNGLIVVEESEGYDGLSRVVIDPQTIYNEGIEEGRNQGGGSGDCNLGTLDMTLTDPYTVVKDASEDGYDGYNQVIVRPDNIIAQQREEAINEYKNKMEEITITENGTYSIDDVELQDSIAFDGNSYFDTGIVPTENIKIEVCIKVTDGNDSGAGGIIIGGGIDSVENGTENRGIAIGMGGGAIYGVWGATKSWNNPYKYEGEGTTTVVLEKTDDSWGWEGEKGPFGASTLYIGGYNKNGEEVEEKFTQSIVYIKIWTNKDDDSTMTLFRPKNMAQGGFGLVNSEGTEYNYVENIGDGTTTFVSGWVNIYPYGFKRVEVNVECVCPSTQETKWVTPSTNDVDDNGFIVIRPDDGYVAMDRVAMDVSTIKSEWTTIGKNSITDYYWCPLTVEDSGFGERAKSFALADEQTVYDENDVLIDRNDIFYLPTANNLNEFRLTKKAVRIEFPFNDVDAQYIGSFYLNDDVKSFGCTGKNLSALSIIEVGKNVTNFVLSNCNLLSLHKIVVHSNENCNVLLTHNVKSTGTLYINENNDFKNRWINALPSGWTVEYL